MGRGASDRIDPPEGLTVLVPDGETPSSLSAVAYYRIRDLLVTLDLAPGAEIDETSLRERLGLGRTPVREAVRRLADEGLVTVYARRGMVASPVDVRDLQRITEVRVELEGLGARRAAERADAADRERAHQLLEEVRTRSEDVRDLLRTDQRVHHCVHRATHNRYLQDTLGTYLTLSLRLWCLGLEQTGHLGEAVDEHRDVLEAVLAGDADRAESAAREHVLHFQETMRRVLLG